jgi:hypothetical protein
VESVPQRGFGLGRGQGGAGRGRRGYQAWGTRQPGRRMASEAGFPPALSRAQEVAALRAQVAVFERSLAGLKSRIQEIDEATPDATGRDLR